jgi:hypothetical protein
MLTAKEEKDQNELKNRLDVPLNLRLADMSSNPSKCKEQPSDSSRRRRRQAEVDAIEESDCLRFIFEKKFDCALVWSRAI